MTKKIVLTVMIIVALLIAFYKWIMSLPKWTFLVGLFIQQHIYNPVLIPKDH